VRPHLEISTPAWSPWLHSDVSKLERVQEKVVKMVAGLQSTTYEDRCKEIGLETLENRRQKQDLCQTYKIIHGLDKLDRDKIFHLRLENIATRQAADPLNLRQDRSRLEVRKNWFSQRVVTKWNELDASIKNAPSLKLFKSHLNTLQEMGRT